MPLLNPLDHYSDLDPWPWGGEPIYRYCDQQLYDKEAVYDASAGSSGPSLRPGSLALEWRADIQVL